QARLAKIYKDRIAFYPLHARVTLNGRPLAGAHVTLSPEGPLGDSIKSADGQTNQEGYATLEVAEADMPASIRGIIRGVQTGLYRISVEHDSQSLPAEVVSGDRHGAEVTAADANGKIEVAIKQR